jgi:hypothetical protein
MVTGDEWWRLLPPGTSGDALRILAARGVRAFADGFVALLLPIYLVELGFNSLAVGAIVASTLIGTALLTLWLIVPTNAMISSGQNAVTVANAAPVAAINTEAASSIIRRECRLIFR